MVKHLKDHPIDDQDEDDLKMHIFLIAIFGTVVFPGRKDIIDERIFEFMHKLIKYKINPIMSILA